MRKNIRDGNEKYKCTKNPEDIKESKDQEEQDPMNIGRRNYAGVAGDSEEGNSKTEYKTKKNDDAKHGKIKNLFCTRTSS